MTVKNQACLGISQRFLNTSRFAAFDSMRVKEACTKLPRLLRLPTLAADSDRPTMSPNPDDEGELVMEVEEDKPEGDVAAEEPPAEGAEVAADDVVPKTPTEEEPPVEEEPPAEEETPVEEPPAEEAPAEEPAAEEVPAEEPQAEEVLPQVTFDKII